ncbi:hypothetical protein BCR39DRAFT_215672 [Naematelia encephala]|uniref:Uncharacterized protein n=1 Tax=Naematelia encephala TaxID=71784 RepID=A0A1Y2B063_9TREE|nr:hypothetical protein BCR39DRAFT_215672 [Naematelia encephala]
MNKHSMLDSSSPTALQRVISASHRLHSTFSPSVDDSRPIRLRGKRPQLGSAPRLPHLVSYIPDPEVRARIRHLVEMGIQRAEQTTQRVFRETIAQTVSIETLDGTSDFDVENMLCDCFEGILQRAVDKILDSVMKVVIKHATSFPQEGLRGNSTFSQHVVYILEQAYLHAQVLTQAECAIVAQRAGISHQQVRTWTSFTLLFGRRATHGVPETKSATSDLRFKPTRPCFLFVWFLILSPFFVLLLWQLLMSRSSRTSGIAKGAPSDELLAPLLCRGRSLSRPSLDQGE